MFEGIVGESVYCFLVDVVVAFACAHVGYGGESHESVAEDRNFFAGLGIGAVGHLVGGDVLGHRGCCICY